MTDHLPRTLSHDARAESALADFGLLLAFLAVLSLGGFALLGGGTP